MLNWAYKNRRVLTVALAFIMVVAIGWFVWDKLHPAQPVTFESQTQAETAKGVELAAKNAHIDMIQSQLEEAARQIAELRNKPPDKVVYTIAASVPQTVEQEREKRGADFAIITDLAKPTETVDITKLEPNTPVNLNQYNIYAYPKIQRAWTIFPDWGDAAKGNFNIKEITWDVNKRISKDGKYLGVVAGYDKEKDQAKLGLRYAY